MRTLIVIVLAIVALGAAGLWALAEFGGGGAQIASGEPVILQEPAPPANMQPIAEPMPAQPGAAPTQEAPPAPAPPAQQPTSRASSKPDALPPEALTAAPPNMRTESASELSPPQSVPAQTGEEILAQPTQTMASASATPTVASAYRSRRVTYNRPPARLILDRAIDVSLVINATDNPDAGEEALQGFPGTIVDRDVDLSDTVSAQLTGVGFDITSQTVDRQKLSGKTINRWQWRVTPTETGTRMLILEIFGYESGSLDAEPLDAYRDEITVEVQQLDQIISWARGIQPVFAVVAGLAAALSALFAFLRFREERKRNTTPAP